ncbi:hypothetical protein M0813_06743 [Anaeramoeba flamelloides]|uniref:E2F/DP family winged-helix DNA-binding domain-containing protein n=1 Tax=Anaeramoeba flamelloides TaxID=1746091 RepID=A0ABQ8XDC5_9EUKA|nr:hypothetical protein M0813_06743 [Anaeramoeba flamelloides]
MTFNPNFFSLFWSYTNFLYTNYQPQQSIKLRKTTKKYFQKYNLYYRNVNEQILKRMESVQQILIQNSILLHRLKKSRKKKEQLYTDPKNQKFLLSKVWATVFAKKSDLKTNPKKYLKRSQKRRLKELQSLENSRSKKTLGVLTFKLIRLIQQKSYTCEELTEITGFLKQRVSKVLRIYKLLNLVTLDQQTLKYSWNWEQSEMVPEINDKIKGYFERQEKKRELLNRLLQIQQKSKRKHKQKKPEETNTLNNLSPIKNEKEDFFMQSQVFTLENNNVNNQPKIAKQTSEQTLHFEPMEVKQETVFQPITKPDPIPIPNSSSLSEQNTESLMYQSAPNISSNDHIKTNNIMIPNSVGCSFNHITKQENQETERQLADQSQTEQINNLNNSEMILQNFVSSNSLSPPQFLETELYENLPSSPFFFETTSFIPLEIPNLDREDTQNIDSLELFSSDLDILPFNAFTNDPLENNYTSNQDHANTPYLEFNTLLSGKLSRSGSNSNLSQF